MIEIWVHLIPPPLKCLDYRYINIEVSYTRPIFSKLFLNVLKDVFKTLQWELASINVIGKFLSHLRFADDLILFADHLTKIESHKTSYYQLDGASLIWILSEHYVDIVYSLSLGILKINTLHVSFKFFGNIPDKWQVPDDLTITQD